MIVVDVNIVYTNYGSTSVMAMFQQQPFRVDANSTVFIDLPVLET